MQRAFSRSMKATSSSPRASKTYRECRLTSGSRPIVILSGPAPKGRLEGRGLSGRKPEVPGVVIWGDGRPHEPRYEQQPEVVNWIVRAPLPDSTELLAIRIGIGSVLR